LEYTTLFFEFLFFTFDRHHHIIKNIRPIGTARFTRLPDLVEKKQDPTQLLAVLITTRTPSILQNHRLKPWPTILDLKGQICNLEYDIYFYFNLWSAALLHLLEQTGRLQWLFKYCFSLLHNSFLVLLPPLNKDRVRTTLFTVLQEGNSMGFKRQYNIYG
jgi:hypothetical protein